MPSNQESKPFYFFRCVVHGQDEANLTLIKLQKIADDAAPILKKPKEKITFVDLIPKQKNPS